MLSTLRIHGYRGFRDRAVLSLASPNGQTGSGITALVGPNGGGKSSVVEAFSFLQIAGQVPSFTEAHRNGATGGRFAIEYRAEDGHETILGSPELGGQVSWRQNDIKLRHGQVLVIPSRRFLEPIFNRTDGSRATHAQSLGSVFQRANSRATMTGRLFALQENRAEFDRILSHVFGRAPAWYIEANVQGQNFLRFSSAAGTHSSEGFGDGLITAFFVADALQDSKPGDLIVLDEPELSLHPAYQRRLAEIVGDYAQDRQIVVATHSPYFVDWSWIARGARVARVHQTDRGSVISNLRPETVELVRPLVGNVRNPHVLGVESREVFFLDDRVVLTEGQEDVARYPAVAAMLGLPIHGHFYGWGVGGVGNMLKVASVLADLGFKRVCGLLDQGMEETLGELRQRFGEYFFACIPAADIRTKERVEAKGPVKGLLDERGRIRRDLFQPMSVLMRRMNDYLSDAAMIPEQAALRSYEIDMPPSHELGEPYGLEMTPGMTSDSAKHTA